MTFHNNKYITTLRNTIECDNTLCRYRQHMHDIVQLRGLYKQRIVYGSTSVFELLIMELQWIVYWEKGNLLTTQHCYINFNIAYPGNTSNLTYTRTVSYIQQRTPTWTSRIDWWSYRNLGYVGKAKNKPWCHRKANPINSQWGDHKIYPLSTW